MSSEQESSNKVAALTQQLESLTNQLTTLKKEAVLEISAQTAQSIQSSQKALMAELKETVENADKNNQKLFIGKTELEEKKSDVAKRDWLQIGLPSLTPIIVAILGYFIWTQQTDIQQQIAKQDKTFAMRMSITEEFYKRKLNVYEDINKQMLKLINDLKNSSANIAKEEVNKTFRALNFASKSQRLYLTEKVAKGVDDVWFAGIACEQASEESDGIRDVIPVEAKITDVQTEMRREIGDTMSELSNKGQTENNQNSN